MLTKRLHLFFLLLFFSILIMTYQSIKGHINHMYYLGYPFNFINEIINTSKNKIEDTFYFLFSLKKENIKLKEKIKQLRIKEQKFDEAIKENSRLRNILSIKSDLSGYVTTAKIIAKDPERWSHILVLDKGTSDGIKKDMSVRTIEGLVGKILSADKNYSKVLLVTDINSSVSVRLQSSRLETILAGTGSFQCNLKYIPNDEIVEVAEVVITSGLDELYPAGIPIGKIISIQKAITGLFQIIQVKPFADSLKIEEVIILKRDKNS